MGANTNSFLLGNKKTNFIILAHCVHQYILYTNKQPTQKRTPARIWKHNDVVVVFFVHIRVRVENSTLTWRGSILRTPQRELCSSALVIRTTTSKPICYDFFPSTPACNVLRLHVGMQDVMAKLCHNKIIIIQFLCLHAWRRMIFQRTSDFRHALVQVGLFFLAVFESIQNNESSLLFRCLRMFTKLVRV